MSEGGREVERLIVSSFRRFNYVKKSAPLGSFQKGALFYLKTR